MILKNNGGPDLLTSRAIVANRNLSKASTTNWLIFVIFSSCISFYLGVWTAWAIVPTSSVNNNVSDLCLKAAKGEDRGDLGRKVGDIFKTRLDKGE
jgi:hypothetical protein